MNMDIIFSIMLFCQLGLGGIFPIMDPREVWRMIPPAPLESANKIEDTLKAKWEDDSNRLKITIVVDDDAHGKIIRSELTRDWKKVKELNKCFDIKVIERWQTNLKVPKTPAYRIYGSPFESFPEGTFASSGVFIETIHYYAFSEWYKVARDYEYRIVPGNIISLDGRVWHVIVENQLQPPNYPHLRKEFDAYMLERFQAADKEVDELHGVAAVALKPNQGNRHEIRLSMYK